MAMRLVLAVAADADGSAKGKMREKLQRLPGLCTRIKLTLVTCAEAVIVHRPAAIEPCKKSGTRRKDGKPHVEVVAPLVLGFSARGTASSPDSKTFAALGSVSVPECA